MPHTFEFDPVHGILRCRAEGKVDSSEARRFYRAARALSSRRQPRGAILDMTAVTALDVSPSVVQELVQAPPSFGDPNVPTLVIAPQPSIYGMVRMFQLMGEKTRPQLRVVRQADEAYSSLGISEPAFEPIESPQA